MRFSQADKYKFCGNYLFYFLSPEVLKQQHPGVYDAFVEVCGSAAWANLALRANYGPLVTIKALEYCGLYPGRSWFRSSNEVYVDECIAKGYENGTGGWQTWEATVLHELTHWARYKGGLSSKFNGEEAGEAFERRAYGRVMPCSNSCAA
jgi:hypothetical protein